MQHKLSKLLMVLLASGVINIANASKDTSSSYGKTHKKSSSKKKHKNYMVGTASFYGENDGFQGQEMADGEALNTNNAHVAAHPTLPLGTKLMVTNLSNGRTIYVEVTDRMPKHGRVIDLSVAGAKYLGMHRKGLTQVELVRITNEEFEEKKRYLEVEDGDSGVQG